MNVIDDLHKRLAEYESQSKFLHALATLLMIRLGGEVEFSESEWTEYPRHRIYTESLRDKNTIKVSLARRHPADA